MSQKLSFNFKNYTLIDLLFIGYMTLLSILILFFGRSVENWFFYIIAHAVIVGLIIVFVPIINERGRGVFKFLRWWYPILLFTFNYKSIDSFTHIIVNGWMDYQVIQFEEFIFGVDLSVWMERFTTPLLTEVMKFFYFTYYLMIPIGAAFLYFAGKRRNYIRYLSAVCLTFYVSYLGFILYPVRGPRYELYDQYTKDYPVNIREFYGPYVEDDVAGKETMALEGYIFTSFQDKIMRYGSLHGGCMPSSHVAVAFVCMMMMWLYKRKVFYFYLPAVMILSVSVVYNRYHYISDVFAGLIVGLLALWLTPRLQKAWERYKYID